MPSYRYLVRESFHQGETMLKTGDYVPDDQASEIASTPEKLRRCVRTIDDRGVQPAPVSQTQ